MADAMPFRFSTKYQDDETDVVCYGHRYYNASSGRWLSRDPIAERGGANLYIFVNNAPVGLYDVLGLSLGIPTCGYGCIQPGSLNDSTGPCSLSYSFDDDPWWEKFAYPSGTKWMQTMAQVKADIEQRMKSCCCIKTIYFSQHNGVPGTLMIGEGNIPPGIFQAIQNEASAAHKRIMQDSIRHEREFLHAVAKHMCKGGKVTFVECESGAGPQGMELQNWLNGIFGPDVNVTLFSSDVRWVYGSPHCTSH